MCLPPGKAQISRADLGQLTGHAQLVLAVANAPAVGVVTQPLTHSDIGI
jgi:hypothetical protein